MAKASRFMITMPPDWKAEGLRQAKRKGLSFSEYLRALILNEAPKTKAKKLSRPLTPGGQSTPKQRKAAKR